MENHLSVQKHDVLRMSNQESNQLTRKCIETAFLQLLNESTFDQITVTSIIRRSGVSRAGFYRNYSSKEILLKELTLTLCRDLSAFINSKEYENNPKQWFIDLFREIRNNQETFRLLFNANIPQEFNQEAKSFFADLFHGKLAQERYYSIALTSAIKDVVIDWFRNGMKESPEEMAQFFMELFIS